MKMILDSYRKTVRDKKDKVDDKIDQYQKEADIMNILAFAIAAKARKYFRSPKAQKMYIDKIHETAVKMSEWDWKDFDDYQKESK